MNKRWTPFYHMTRIKLPETKKYCDADTVTIFCSCRNGETDPDTESGSERCSSGINNWYFFQYFD